MPDSCRAKGVTGQGSFRPRPWRSEIDEGVLYTGNVPFVQQFAYAIVQRHHEVHANANPEFCTLEPRCAADDEVVETNSGRVQNETSNAR